MGMWKSFWAGVASRAAKYAGIPLRDPALVQMLGNQPTVAGVDVDPAVAMNFSAVWQAVGIISSTVAAMPPTPYKGGEPQPEHWSYDLLTVEPNDEMTPYTFYETLTAHCLTWGNGYAAIVRDEPTASGRVEPPVIALDPLMPNQTTPERDPADGRIVYRFQSQFPGEEDRVYESCDVLHVAGLGFDGLRGYNVIDNARESIGLGGAVEKYGAAFFGRGSAPGGLLQLPEGMEMTEKGKKNLRESFELMHRGPDNAHRVAVLEDGVTYQSLGLPLETAQFLQTRVFQIREIARWFNIAPHLLRDLEFATFSNIEHQGIDFLVYTLMPWLMRWKHEIRRKLFSPGERRTMTVHHDTHALLLTDISARYSAYNIGRTGGWLTLNDILRREGAKTLPKGLGDSRLVPLNMRAVDEHGRDVFDQPAEEAGEAGEAGAVASDVQATAMNGIQISAMKELLISAAAGELPVESVESMLKAAFPGVPSATVAAMLKPIREGFKSAVPTDGGTPDNAGEAV